MVTSGHSGAASSISYDLVPNRTVNCLECGLLDDAMLVAAAQAGEERAFIELCARYRQRAFSMIHRVTKNREDTEDALQESMMRAFLHPVSYTHLDVYKRQALGAAFVPPFEWQYFLIQVEATGWQSLPLIAAAGLALGVVMTMHTRSLLVSLGAGAWAPTLQSASFFNELGPLVTGLLVAGRAGAGIGAELANMRVTEQIDAIEVFSIDSFKFLVVTRILACILVLPLLTVFMDTTGLLGLSLIHI